MNRWIITTVALVGGLALTLQAGEGAGPAGSSQSGDQAVSNPSTGPKEVASSEALVRANLETELAEESADVTPMRTSDLTTLRTKNLELQGASIQYYNAPKDLRLFHLVNPMAPAEYFPERPDRPAERPWAFTDPMTSEPSGFKFLSISF